MVLVYRGLTGPSRDREVEGHERRIADHRLGFRSSFQLSKTPSDAGGATG